MVDEGGLEEEFVGVEGEVAVGALEGGGVGGRC